MNIILIGFKSAGKSSVGKLLGKQLNRTFIDIDDKIAEIYEQKNRKKCTAREIYIKLGDVGFRILEKEATLALSKTIDSIVATGGGTVCDSENVRVLKEDGWLVYLDVPIEVLRKRILGDASLDSLDLNHPARRFEESFNERQKIYQALADLIIDAKNKTTEEIVNIIEESFYGE